MFLETYNRGEELQLTGVPKKTRERPPLAVFGPRGGYLNQKLNWGKFIIVSYNLGLDLFQASLGPPRSHFDFEGISALQAVSKDPLCR